MGCQASSALAPVPVDPERTVDWSEHLNTPPFVSPPLHQFVDELRPVLTGTYNSSEHAAQLVQQGLSDEALRLMLDEASPLDTRLTAAWLFLRLGEFAEEATERSLLLDQLAQYDLDTDAATGSDCAAIIPAVHRESGRNYVLKMQHSWEVEEGPPLDEWGNIVEWKDAVQQGAREWEALQLVGAHHNVIRGVTSFVEEELPPPPESDSEEEGAAGEETEEPPMLTHYMVLEQWDDDGEQWISGIGLGGEGMEERAALMVLLQLGRAMERCAACGVTSNDFKLNNVLVNTMTGTICLADFGLWSPSGDDYKFRGSSYNKAPEALLELHDPAILALQAQAPPGTKIDRKKMDMWALGCTAYQLAHGWSHPRDEAGHPFHCEPEKVFQYIRGKYTLPRDIPSPALQNVADALLCPHPAHRPSAAGLVSWLRSMLWPRARSEPLFEQLMSELRQSDTPVTCKTMTSEQLQLLECLAEQHVSSLADAKMQED